VTVARAAARVAAAGAAAGIVSGAPSAAWWLLARRGQPPVAATREIGRRFTGRRSFLVGGAVHLALSAAFAWPGPLLARARRPAVAGAGYGLALWLVNFRLLAPRAWPEVRRLDGAHQVADHLDYGAALGGLAGRLLAPRGSAPARARAAAGSRPRPRTRWTA
jgi:hypothetical protein